MRFHAPLDDVLRGRTALAVLRTLVSFPGKEFTGRELATVAGVAPSKAIVELNRLLRSGVVERRTAGRTHLWRAVEGHFLFGILQRALVEEGRVLLELQHTLADELARPYVRSAFLFGSVARGQEAPDSDVDAFVVVAREADKGRLAPHVATACESVLARFGNQLHVVVYSEAEARRKRALAFQKAARKGVPLVRGGVP